MTMNCQDENRNCYTLRKKTKKRQIERYRHERGAMPGKNENKMKIKPQWKNSYSRSVINVVGDKCERDCGQMFSEPTVHQSH
jgi:hypothetical protein